MLTPSDRKIVLERAADYGLERLRQAIPHPRPRRRGFTMIEALVCTGVLASLIALLLPTVNRARELSRRAKCAANLHGIGFAAQNFAQDHNGYFPVCYYMPSPQYPFRFPLVISRDATLEDSSTLAWRQYGTPWQTFNRYGADVGSFDCPSTQTRTRDIDSSTAPPEWGSVIWTDYMYVGGMTSSNLGRSYARWGTAVPAVAQKDKFVSREILAADAVFYSGGGSYQWDSVGPRYIINHPINSVVGRVDFQNVLYGDGRVEGHGRDSFATTLTTSNYSLQFAQAPVGGFLYWGPDESNTWLGFDPKPTPTTPVPTPTPTPPKPPSPPPPPPILPHPIPGGDGS